MKRAGSEEYLAPSKGGRRQGAAPKQRVWRPKGGEAPSTVGGRHQGHSYGPPPAKVVAEDPNHHVCGGLALPIWPPMSWGSARSFEV